VSGVSAVLEFKNQVNLPRAAEGPCEAVRFKEFLKHVNTGISIHYLPGGADASTWNQSGYWFANLDETEIHGLPFLKGKTERRLLLEVLTMPDGEIKRTAHISYEYEG